MLPNRKNRPQPRRKKEGARIRLTMRVPYGAVFGAPRLVCYGLVRKSPPYQLHAGSESVL